nr:hypothetical protein [Tanacetum cinerariifolium]
FGVDAVEDFKKICSGIIAAGFWTACYSYYCQYKVSVVQIVSAASIVVNTVSRGCIQTGGKIVEIDADEDVTLEEVDAEVTKDADVQGRLEESQANVYHLDLEHDEKVISMQDTNEAEPAKVEEVIEVVTASKLMTEVVTTAATTITAAPVPKASAPRKRRGVIIQDPEEAATASIIMQSDVMSKDKGKGILVKEPKPLKRQAQIEPDEAFARELKAELNANINWNDVVDQVKRKERQDNTVMRYQALKRKPVTEAHVRKNMMVYLKNMAGFKMDFFRGMTYTDIRPIFEKHYNLNQAFLERVEERSQARKKKKEVKEKVKVQSSEQLRSKGLMKRFTHSQLNKKSFKDIQGLYIKEQELITDFVPIGSKEDERMIRDINKKAKLESSDKDPDKEGVIDYEVLDKRFLIINWESKFYHYDRHRAKGIYYRNFRSDGSSRWIKTFSEMATRFDRLDLVELYNLVMQRFEPTTPEEDGTEIHMLAERRYPLTTRTLERMLSLRLIVESASDAAYDLL